MYKKHIAVFLIMVFCSSIAVAAEDRDVEQFKDKFKEAIKNPRVAKLIGNERINLYLDGHFEGHIVTENNEITSMGEDKLNNPTLEVYVNLKESKGLATGELDFLDAIEQGIIRFKGVGFFKGLKFGSASFASKSFSFFRRLFKNPCKDITCDDSALTCADGTEATCRNKCKRFTGKCSECTPKCETAPADSDGDGIPDEVDVCPNIAGTLNGCPAVTDTDGDGIADTDDLCPQNAGPASNKGCPPIITGTSPSDSDDDGVADADDLCPQYPGPSKNSGCPFILKTSRLDSDGDGVIDDADQCPMEAGPVTNDGCPAASDQDGDGVPDADDNCPAHSNPNQEDADGDMVGDACELGQPIADQDGDGFPDANDNCPTVAGKVNGCPPDQDGDGVADADDNCPAHSNPNQEDTDGDMVGDACDSTPIPTNTVLHGSILTNANQMNSVIRIIFTDVNNPTNTHESDLTLDSGSQLKNFVFNVGFNIMPSTSYEITYEWVSGGTIAIVSSVIESIKVIGPADGIKLGVGTQATQTSATATFTIGAVDPCGNGVLDLGEECDDGNLADHDGCDSTCLIETTPICGDGVVDAHLGEMCDDGNLADGDGCTSTCVTEACGNGVLNIGEECDDGNLADGDGCAVDCTLEPGY